MDASHAKKMMDAFYEAKRIRDQMPPLPEGVCASYIHTLDAVRQLSRVTPGQVRISDVADFQQLPRPVVTRTIKEMEGENLLLKQPDPEDKRVVHIALTREGEALYQTYVTDYFGALVKKLEGISNEEADAMTGTIHKIRGALEKNGTTGS